MTTLAIVSLMVLFGCSRLGESSKILVIPSGSFSHFLEMVPIANELLARQHEIYVLVAPEQQERIVKVNARYNVVTYNALSMMKLEVVKDSCITKPATTLADMQCLINEVKVICTSVMEDNSMWQLLESQKFDLALVDNFLFACSFLIPHRLGIPYVSTGTHVFPRYSNLPFLPSLNQMLAGFENFGFTVCNEDSSCPRLLKTLRRFFEYVAARLAAPEDEYLHKYVNYSTIDAVRLNVSLTITNLDHILEYVPLPQMPNVLYVGGLTVKPARALPEELHSWLNQSSCVALVNFGTRVANLHESTTQRLLDAFGRVRCDILYRCVDCQSYSVPKNVRLAGWIPQNDLLAHENVKAFVTHSGNNGQYEALYHGVPMVAFYVDGDQLRNARRVERKGFGRRASFEAFEVEQLAALMNDVIENGTYKQAIQKASEIFRSVEHPVVRAANGIERVLKFGTLYENLITSEYYSSIEFYSVDVVFVLFSLVLLVFYLLVRFIAVLLKRVIKFVV